MSLPLTEMRPLGDMIDTMAPSDAAGFMLDGQIAALAAVRKASNAIVSGAGVMARTIRNGGSLIYAAAGSSGLMALADASELTGTFGIPPARIRLHMAGGVPTEAHMPGATEDDGQSAKALAAQVSPKDVVITLSASGTTPFAVAFAREAKARGAQNIAIANTPGTPLLALADVAICLQTPPEVIAGSTRLGAGTSQKVALNMMSTLMGINLGHVYQGMMVNVVADNAKLIQRATGIVAALAGVCEDSARKALTAANGQVKAAILIASGLSPSEANRLLKTHNARLDDCFNALNSTSNHAPQTSIQGD